MPKLAIQKTSIFERLDPDTVVKSYDEKGKAQVDHQASARANYHNALEGFVDAGKSVVAVKDAYEAWSPAGAGGAPGVLLAVGGALLSASVGFVQAEVNAAQGLVHSLAGAAKTLFGR